MKISNEDLLKEESFTKEEVLNAALIIHPKSKRINLTKEELCQILIFENGSNLTPLKKPIKEVKYDKSGKKKVVLKYWCSEGYYMAQRTDNLDLKQMIALLSTGFLLATKARDLYDLEQDEVKRIEYMRNAIREKFDNNPGLKKELMATGDKTIIEYTYRGDTRFGIDQETLKGKNILGKLLMEYRDSNK